MQLRPYQLEAKEGVYSAWAQGAENAILVLPTGGGKSAISASVVHDHNGPSCVIAHRQELVSQLSIALARDGVRHRIIGPANITKLCVNLHMEELGVNYVDPRSRVAVAGVDTLVRREVELASWLHSVTLWVIDECHHVLSPEHNKWGKATAMFPNAKGLGVTATPLRADGKGLGRHADGVFDEMVVGPSMGDLLKMGFLSPYKIFAPPSDLDLNLVALSAKTGDYNPASLSQATRSSHVMGDVVDHYLRIAKGKRGITFTTDVESAKEVAQRFNEAGVPALALDAKTPDAERVSAMRRFKKGEILQLVNVELFGEGTDVPAVEVVSMARATASYGLYVQIFGRALRILEGKSHAIIIDHVGNVVRHGLPDAPRKWTLDRRESRKTKAPDPDVIPVKACTSCMAIYERVYPECPYCGFKPIPSGRTAPELVDGDLCELDEATLAAMRGEIERVDKDPEEYRLELAAKYTPVIGQMGLVKKHKTRQEAQALLRDKMMLWGGHRVAEGMPLSESQRRFFFKFGVDVMSAQALGTNEAFELGERIQNDIGY